MISFRDVRGHETPISILRQTIRGSSAAHALMLEGPSGVGKRLTALAAAALHLCRTPEDDQPCGSCPACRQMTAGSHFGFWLIDPEISREDRDPDDPDPIAGLLPRLFEDSSARGKIGIDPVRALRDELTLKPSGDPRRAVVLADFDRATADAQNALLKTLEEPPAQTLLLCTVSSREGVPDTVTSRCQRLRFSPLSTDQVIKILRVESDLEPDRRTFIANMSGGRPGLALRFASGELLEHRNWFVDQVESYGGPEDPRFREAMIDRLSSGGEGQRETFEDLMMLYRAFLQDALYDKLDMTDHAHLHFPPDTVRAFTREQPLDRIMNQVDRLEKLERARDLYVNEKVLIENMPCR